MGVRVVHTIGDLERDLTTMAMQAPTALRKVVHRNVIEGNRLARNIARSESGPHGRLYYKRITSEMTGLLTGEYGPTGAVVGKAVGAGWRGGVENTDLEKSAEVISWRFGPQVLDAAADLFWPGS